MDIRAQLREMGALPVTPEPQGDGFTGVQACAYVCEEGGDTKLTHGQGEESSLLTCEVGVLPCVGEDTEGPFATHCADRGHVGVDHGVCAADRGQGGRDGSSHVGRLG